MRIPELVGRKLARVATEAVTRRPALWRVFRPLLRTQFEGLAPVWDRIVSPGHLDPLLAALEGVEPPRRAVDVGTGTGAAALAVAERAKSSATQLKDVRAGVTAPRTSCGRDTNESDA
jgi:methylase of polypeptide subunit release factors